jgi:diaminopimelate epimerase
MFRMTTQMLQKFLKCHSLGNDLIFLDWFEKTNQEIQTVLTHKNWKKFVIDSCGRHTGVGADGILILTKHQELKLPQAFIFNSDGSQAEICLNGLRCIAHYLFTHYSFPEHFKVLMGPKSIDCHILQKNGVEIVNKIETANYIGESTIEIDHQKVSGHIVDVGNPHFVIFKKAELDWLKQFGNQIETHPLFKNKTNVEFIWQEPEEQNSTNFNVLVHERGCGITLACSSGAAAINWTLFCLKKININEIVNLKMIGGDIFGFIDEKHKITLQAKAHFIFEGKFLDFNLSLEPQN